jgi:class 3 adenylate cyclase/CHASE2 domain-containing sensor protein
MNRLLRNKALWAGLALTAIAAGVHLTGVLERLELVGYDYLVAHFSSVPASPRILHVDIDDDALERVESWPWPRDMQGELIRILHELGASHVLMDIVWTEPKRAEVRVPGLTRYADLEGQVEQVGDISPENVVYPDDELARAVAESGPVLLAMYYGENAREPGSPVVDRVAAQLRQDFSLTATDVAKRLWIVASDIEDVLAGAKRQVAEERVAAVLTTRPAASAAEVHAAILSTPFERETADRADVLAAYERQLGLRTLREKCPAIPEGLRGRLPRVERLTPPVYKFTAGAAGVGFVTYQPDFDGRVRRIPLMAEWDGRLVEQLAFRQAREALGIRVEDLSLDARGDLVIAAGAGRPEMRVQLDERGQMLINWHVAPAGWHHSFAHLPVTQLLQIYDARQKQRENEIRRQVVLARAMRLAKDDAGYEAYRQQVNALLEKERQVRWARLQGRGETAEAKSMQADAAGLRKRIEADEKSTIEFVREQWTALQGEANPKDPQIAGEYKRFGEAHRLVVEDAAELARVNERIAAQEREYGKRLKAVVAGKLCIVGYTATAVADMVGTSAYGRVAGVMVHSNVLNSLLLGQFRAWSPRWVQTLVLIAVGVTVSIVAATRGPRVTLAFVLVVIVIGVVVDAVGLFERRDHWLPLVTTMLSTCVVWALVVLVQYLTTDRQRRRFSRALAQYVSPAVARQITEHTERLDLSPVSQVVTCFFSDLAGFTRFSERLGPEGTRALLNPYLEAMSGVLHRRSALINKFIGDGIFAFFNPPVLPCPVHAAEACAAALESQRALAELAERHTGHALAGEFSRLRMRIGVATGPVFVGDYGSEEKLDYTCMGDTVNLASRLEGANKAFGTTIMVSGPACEAAGDGFVFRPLGYVQVKGQTVAVPIFELLGERGEVAADELAYAEKFAASVGAFTARDWARARTGFTACLESRSADVAARQYLALAVAYQEQPPPDEWNRAVELTEK